MSHLFKPGQSGNPTGRPKKLKEIADAIKESTEEGMKCINLFLEIMESKKASNRDRIAAATKLLEYAYGKPLQQNTNINTNIEVDKDRQFTINFIKPCED